MELILKNLSKTYANGAQALKDVSLNIEKGMFQNDPVFKKSILSWRHYSRNILGKTKPSPKRTEEYNMMTNWFSSVLDRIKLRQMKEGEYNYILNTKIDDLVKEVINDNYLKIA